MIFRTVVGIQALKYMLEVAFTETDAVSSSPLKNLYVSIGIMRSSGQQRPFPSMKLSTWMHRHEVIVACSQSLQVRTAQLDLKEGQLFRVVTGNTFCRVAFTWDQRLNKPISIGV